MHKKHKCTPKVNKDKIKQMRSINKIKELFLFLTTLVQLGNQQLTNKVKQLFKNIIKKAKLCAMNFTHAEQQTRH